MHKYSVLHSLLHTHAHTHTHTHTHTNRLSAPTRATKKRRSGLAQSANSPCQAARSSPHNPTHVPSLYPRAVGNRSASELLMPTSVRGGWTRFGTPPASTVAVSMACRRA